MPISSELVVPLQKRKEKGTLIVIKRSLIVACNVIIQEQSMKNTNTNKPLGSSQPGSKVGSGHEERRGRKDKGRVGNILGLARTQELELR